MQGVEAAFNMKENTRSSDFITEAALRAYGLVPARVPKLPLQLTPLGPCPRYLGRRPRKWPLALQVVLA